MKMLEITYGLETGGHLVDYRPTKNVKKSEKKILKNMDREYFDVGPCSVETAGVIYVRIKEHDVH